MTANVSNPKKIATDNFQISIQFDWDTALKNLKEKVWVSVKTQGNLTVYGTIVRVDKADDKRSFEAAGGFKIIDFKGKMLHVGLLDSERSTIFVSPRKQVSAIHQKKSVNSVAANANGMIASAVGDKIIVWNFATEEIKLSGHLGDVYKCKYFPSGKVILSCGSDMQLKIWDMNTGKCAVTLSGHRSYITDIGFVERGKNIISVSNDGILKLWNCGDSSCLDNVAEEPSCINCCEICDAPSGLDLQEPNETQSEKEVLTNGKMVIFGCEDGSVGCVALKSRTKLYTKSSGSPVNSLILITDDFIIGCKNGLILMYNLVNHEKPKATWSESQSAVLSLLGYKNVGFFASRTDGTVSFTFLDRPHIRISLTGSNCDPVYGLASDDTFIYTCCRDNHVRNYRVTKLIDELITQ